MVRSSTVVPRTQIPYFGGCPECGRTKGYMNVGRSQWFVCDTHRTRWCVGMNLFSSWRDESEDEWRRNAVRLEGYREVEPLRPSFDGQA